MREMTDIYKPGYKKWYKPGYIDVICLEMLLIIFFVTLFLTNGVWFIIDVLLLAGTAAVFGRTVGEMVTA